MTWQRDAAFLGAGAFLAWLLRGKAAGTDETEKWQFTDEPLVLEPDFTEEEEDDILEAEVNDGYVVLQDNALVGKVWRVDADPDSQWWAVVWLSDDGESTEAPEHFDSKEAAAEWVEAQVSS